MENRPSRLAAIVIAQVCVLTSSSMAQPVPDGERHLSLWASDISTDGKRPRYTREFDLSKLPKYAPRQQLSGWLRIHGSETLAEGMLGEYWQQGFAKFHPNARLSYFLPTFRVGLAPLYYDQAELALVHTLGFYDLLPYQRVKNFDPVQIRAFTGSYDLRGVANPHVILVHEDNPLTRISIEQLDGIFGAERDGGWAGTNWRPDLARGPETNIRRWGQMGLKGEWATKPINPHGFSMRSTAGVAFADRVLKASDKWNESIMTYGPYFKADGTAYTEEEQIAQAVAKDRHAIAFSLNGKSYPGTKRLALAETNQGPYVDLTIENVQNRSYPMANEGSFYVTVKPGGQINPLVKEFLRYVLSQEGQAEVQRDGKYLPLTAGLVNQELQKLE